MSGLSVRVEGLSRTFRKGGEELRVLRDLDFVLSEGESVAIVGQSGSGKSTFLQILGTLDRPSAGQVYFDGRPVFRSTDRELCSLRNKEIGFVFQFHHLLPDHDALRNVMMPALIGGVPTAQAEARAHELLEKVGLGNRVRHRPGQLSGGEQQRVAIARAMARQPRLVLADEPTGNLDPSTADGIYDALMELNAEQNTSLVVVTHSTALARRFPRQLRLEQGRFVDAVGGVP